MELGCGLTSVRGNRGENYVNEPLVRQKHTKKKKKLCPPLNFILKCSPHPTPQVVVGINI
jgi:hypothetical protein